LALKKIFWTHCIFLIFSDAAKLPINNVFMFFFRVSCLEAMKLLTARRGTSINCWCLKRPLAWSRAIWLYW